MADFQKEDHDIPIIRDNINLKSSLYYSTSTPNKTPLIINMAGLLDHRESYFVKYYTEKFVNAGYHVFSYDYRAHGETKKQTGSRWDKMIPAIFSDIHEVISWLLETQKHRILNEKITLFGRSLGGAIILTHGFIEERVNKLIALCTRYDYHTTQVKFSEEVIKKMSPMHFLKSTDSNHQRVFIAHCKDDPRIPYSNFNLIKEHLGLNERNAIDYEEGGHSFKGYRDELFEKILAFLKDI